MIGYDSAAEAVKMYHDHLLTLAPESAITASVPVSEVPVYRPVTMISVDLEHPGTGTRGYLLPGEPLTVHIGFEAMEPVPDMVIGVEIYDQIGELLYASDTEILDQHFDVPAGSGRADLTFEHIPFLDGGYTLAIDLKNRQGLVIDRREMMPFEVMNPGRSAGTVSLEMRAEIRTASLS